MSPALQREPGLRLGRRGPGVPLVLCSGTRAIGGCLRVKPPLLSLSHDRTQGRQRPQRWPSGAWVGAGGAACPWVCPQLSHDGNETLPLHLFVKSYDKNIDSKLRVTLYNCSFGRSDCSLCLAADPAYKCVWCGGQGRCVYEALCSNATSECPPPVITRVSPSGLPAGSGGAGERQPVPARLHGPARPSCRVSWALPIFRSSPRQAPWVGAFVSPSLGRIWESEQMT